jgi:hypothetical protein
MTKIGNITFGKISNVKKSGDVQGVYYCDVEISPDEGFPFEVNFYCATPNDYAKTGQWVYAQIQAGNFEGSIQELAPNVDPMTGEPWPEPAQPTVQGAQTL